MSDVIVADGKANAASAAPARPTWLLAALPAALFLAGVMVLPLVLTVATSITDPQPGLGNYKEFFGNPAFVRILFRTVWTGALVTLVCLLLGYPYAYLMALAGRRLRILMTVAVLLPFWTSAVVRTFAWVIILQPSGLINRALGVFGLGPFELIGNLTGSMIGMTHIMLPLMVLPLYATMAGIDRRLLVAASGLGATPLRAFWKVYLPLSRPGIVAGCIVVFVSALGFYLIPQLLGSPRQQLLSQLIVDQVSALLNFGLGATMACILLVVTVALLAASTSTLRGTGQYGTVAINSSGKKTTISGRRPFGLWLYSALIGLFLVVPSLIVVPLSFTAQASFVFPPRAWSLRWYQRFFTDPEWTSSLFASLKIAGLTTILATALGTIAALGIVRSRSRLAMPVQMFILLPRVVPHVVVAIAVYAVFLVAGLTGTVFGFVVTHTALAIPLVVIAVAAGLQSLDQRLETAAASLGATRPRQLRKVTLPLILPSVVTGAVFAFITSFDEVIVSLFLQSPYLLTLPVKMFSSIQDQIDPTIAAASSLILLVATASILATMTLGARRDQQSG